MEEQSINEKNVLTANQMIGELLLGLVQYGVIFFIIYRIIYALIYKYFTENQEYILLTFIIILLNALSVFATFKFGNKKALKKGNIYKKDVPKIMGNIGFVVVVLLLIQAFSMFASVNTAIDTAIEDNLELKYTENLLSYLYDEKEMAIYQAEKEKAIEESKNQIYKYLAVVEIGISVVYISAIFFEKKYLCSKAI